MEEAMKTRIPFSHLAAEALGTALLVLVGLSFVILDFGSGSFVTRLVPSDGLRRLVTGFLFGATGGLIAVSPLGRISGAHINPVVSFAFWVKGRMRGAHALGYAIAQLAGAAAGALPLFAWGSIGRSVAFGSTVPGEGYGPWSALAGEAAATFTMVILLLFFVSHKGVRRFTPALFPFLYAAMVFLEAPVSGTSTNPARSLAPLLLSGHWRAWWVYWAGPFLGAFLAVVVHTGTWLNRLEIEVAKLYHFEHDPHGVFRWRRPERARRGA
jgi:aquaporin Z